MLKDIFRSYQIKKSKEDLLKWGKDWTQVVPNPSVVVFPENDEQISDLVKYAVINKKKIVPSGGRTGLSGGACAVNEEIVLSMDRMNNILDFNITDKLIKCQSGVITKNIQELALQEGLFYPVDFSSSGSSQIGGNVATNAGGIRVIRYGLTRNWVSGIKIIDGIGRSMSFNEGLIKNASGYDFRHLLIGSEGTLGIITEVDIRLTKKPLDQSVMLLGLSNSRNLTNVLSKFTNNVDVSAFEFFSAICLEKVNEHHKVIDPFKNEYDFYALVEFDNKEIEKIQESFETCLRDNIIEDGIISSTQNQASSIWKLRENISESISKYRPYKNDVSVKISLVPEFLEKVTHLIEEFNSQLEVCMFGHIGDGNIHINLLRPDKLTEREFKNITDEITHKVYTNISDWNGSISAEHGIGLIKKDYLTFTRSKIEIEMMKDIKNIFDPHQIFNPGKLI